MNCFCQQTFIKDSTSIIDIFEDLLKENPDVASLSYDCISWSFTLESLRFFILASFSIVGINALATHAFVWLAKYEKLLNKTQENILIFNLIFIQTLVNTALIFTFGNTFILSY
jgi:hypothetical protein